MATVTPPANRAEPKKVLPAPPKAAAGKVVPAKPSTTIVTKPAAAAPKPAAATPAKSNGGEAKAVAAVPAAAPKITSTRTPVKGVKAKEGIAYYAGQGQPPCYKDFDAAAEECSPDAGCVLKTPCAAATEAVNKPTLVTHFAHPKKDLIKKDGDEGYAAGFQRIGEILDEARKAAEQVLEKPTLQIAEIAGRLHNGLTKETFEQAGEKYLHMGYRHVMRFVKVQEKFGHLPSAEALQLVENCGSQANLFEVCKSEDPIALARKGEVTFVDATSGKKVTKKLADLSKREVPVALKAAPGVKMNSRTASKDVKAAESKAKPMPLVRRIAGPVTEQISALKEIARKAKVGDITLEDLRELKPLPGFFRDAATAIETLIGKAAKAPTKSKNEAVLDD